MFPSPTYIAPQFLEKQEIYLGFLTCWAYFSGLFHWPWKASVRRGQSSVLYITYCSSNRNITWEQTRKKLGLVGEGFFSFVNNWLPRIVGWVASKNTTCSWWRTSSSTSLERFLPINPFFQGFVQTTPSLLNEWRFKSSAPLFPAIFSYPSLSHLNVQPGCM